VSVGCEWQTMTADSILTARALPEKLLSDLRGGSAPPTSDNVQGVQPAETATPLITRDRWYTPEMVGAIIGVQGQRVRQVIRALRKSGVEVGTKFGPSWLLSADDIGRIAASRQKEQKKMNARKSAQVLALEGLAHIGRRIESLEKDAERRQAEQWEIKKRLLAMDDRMNEFDRKVLEYLEPKPHKR